MASLEAEASALSSVASSQDSLHKQPKKKGIKSSIGRLFGKKEKGRLAHLAHRQVMVDPQGDYCSETFTFHFINFQLMSVFSGKKKLHQLDVSKLVATLHLYLSSDINQDYLVSALIGFMLNERKCLSQE